MEGIERLLREHEFFRGMSPDYLEIMAGCASNVKFEEGEYLAREGDQSRVFFALRAGKVALELPSLDEPITIQTLRPGEILGWSWLFPPYQWLFDGRALETVRAVRFDCSCLNTKCENDPVMGYEFLKRFSGVVVDRLRATRLQLLDVYGTNITV